MAKTYTIKRAKVAKCPFCGGIWPVTDETATAVTLPFHNIGSVGKPIQPCEPQFGRRCTGSDYLATVTFIDTDANSRPGVRVPLDTDIFPFGVYGKAGKTYSQVPADYLDWCMGQPWMQSRHPQVVAYVEANRRAIDKELGD